MGAGLSAEDLGFESPLCVGTNSQSMLLAETWGLHLDPVIGVCKGTFLGKLVASLYAVLSWAVFNIGGIVSPLRRKHT